MNKTYSYKIRIEGCLPESSSDWFEGMVVNYDAPSKTTTIGKLADQAALIGVLNRIQALNLMVISVERSLEES